MRGAAACKSGRSLGISRKQLFALQMRADGKDLDEIARRSFDCTDERQAEDPAKLERAKIIVRKWFRSPVVNDAYRQIMRDTLIDFLGPAIWKLKEELNKPDSPWLENKAANDIINKAFPLLFGEEEKSIVVKVEGMPDLGTPDADEETADDDD